MRVVCAHPDNTEGAFVDTVPAMPMETEVTGQRDASRGA